MSENHKENHWMGDEELKQLVKEPESSYLERCGLESQGSPKNLKDKLPKTITAFSNNLAGRQKASVFFLGIEDNGEFSGLNPTDQIQTTISNIQSSGNIQPLPLTDIKLISIDKYKVIAIQVLPSKSPPVRHKGQCWIRRGASNHIASPDEERLLTEKQRAENLSDDMQEVPGTNIESDLNMTYLIDRYLASAISSEVLRENNRELKTQLRSLRLLGPNDLPTMTALLIAGKDARYRFPGAYIQFIRFEGQELTDPIKNQREVSGTLEDQIKEIEDVLRQNISTALEIGGTRHILSPDYPFPALSQLIRNAVLHRDYRSNAPVKVYWYADRVEIQSPGGPYGKLNLDNFGSLEGITDYRNPGLAEAFKYLGLIERFGFGLPKTRKALKENGNPDLELEASAAVILATVYLSKDK